MDTAWHTVNQDTPNEDKLSTKDIQFQFNFITTTISISLGTGTMYGHKNILVKTLNIKNVLIMKIVIINIICYYE